MRKIDADHLKETLDYYIREAGWGEEINKALGWVKDEFIDSEPTVEPEIIRCRDCKYWQDQEEGVVEVPICARPGNKYEKHPFVMIAGAEDYCSFAKRRTDAKDRCGTT